MRNQRILLLLVLLLITSQFYAQNTTQSMLLPISSSEVVNFHDPTAPLLQLPIDPNITGPIHDESILNSTISHLFSAGDEDDCNSGSKNTNYVGQHPVFCQAVVHDKYGNVLMQIVDNNIYNRFGESFLITDPQQTAIYDECHYWLHQGTPDRLNGDCGCSLADYESEKIGEYLNRSYVTNPSVEIPTNHIVLSPEIVVIPVPESPNDFFLIYGTNLINADPSESTCLNVFYRKVTFFDIETIEITPPICINHTTSGLDFSNGRLSLAVTKYRPDQQNYILFVDDGDLEIFEITTQGIDITNHKEVDYGNLQNSYSGFNRAEMEVIDYGQEYLLAYPVSGTKPYYHLVKFPYQFSSIQSFTTGTGEPDNYFNTSTYYSANSWYFELSSTISGRPVGMEFDGGQNKIYFTFENQDNFYYADYSNLPSAPIISTTSISNASYYDQSHIELGRDEILYFQGDDGNANGYIGKLNPSSMNWSSFTHTLYKQNDYQFTSAMGMQQRYTFMDQVDGSEYLAYATLNPASGCSYFCDKWPALIPTPTPPYVYNWSPGIGNNPWNSIDGTVTLCQDIVIEEDYYISIFSMKFMMDEDKIATLNSGSSVNNEGAILYLHNTTFTTIEGCDILWGGFLLDGDQNYSQIQLMNTRQPYLRFESSLIENAVVGIESIKGGIIRSISSTIRNNIVGVKIFGYIDPVNPTMNLCHFESTEFYTDKVLNSNEIPGSHVYLNEVTSIEFKKCDFWNSRNIFTTPVEERGMGIYGTNAGFLVLPDCAISPPLGDPCPPQHIEPSTFESLYYGIKAEAYISRPVKIYANDFVTNHRGIYLSGYQNSEVTHNDIEVGMLGLYQQPPGGSPNKYAVYGAYFNECTGYDVSYNRLHDGYLGMIVNNSGIEFNRIFHNEFENLNNSLQGGGLIVLNENAKLNWDGLVLICNKFFNNSYHISLLGSSAIIKEIQAKNTNSLTNPVSPADNIFLPSNPGGEKEFYIENWNYQIDYHEYTNDPIQIWHTELIAYTISDISKTQYVFDPQTTAPWEDRCILLELSHPRTETLSDLDYHVDSLETVLENLIDNGNTPLLEFEVVSISSATKQDVKDNLMETAPYTSDEVFSELLNEANTFTSYDKSEILIENSPLPADVESEVESSDISSLHKEIISQYQAGQSARVLLEQYKQGIDDSRTSIYNHLLSRYSINDTLSGSRDSVELLLNLANTPECKLRQIDYYCAIHDYTNASDAITEIGTDLNVLDPERQMELINYLSLMEIVLEYRQSTTDSLRNALVLENLTFLSSMANSFAKGYVRAQTLLEAEGIDDFDELILLQEGTSSKLSHAPASGEKTNTYSDDVEIEIFPNPASDQITINYALLNFTNQKICIYDMNGKKALKKDLVKPIASFNLDISNLSTGKYLVKIGDDLTRELMIVR